MIATAQPTAEIWEVADADYYADAPNSVSHSEMEVFRESPRLYWGRFIKKLPDWQQEETDALEFGHLFEDTLYPPETGGPLVIPREVLSKSGARSGAAWEQFCEVNGGRRLIKAEQKAVLDAMVESVKKHTWARKLLIEINGKRQVAIRFKCPHTEVWRRAKLDHKFKSAVVDLKTARSADAESFARDAIEYGYHRQADWYREGVHELTGYWLPFLFVVVQKTPPFTVNVFELPPRIAELGHLDNLDDLKRYKGCLESGIWEPDGHGEILELPIPPRARYEKNWPLT